MLFAAAERENRGAFTGFNPKCYLYRSFVGLLVQFLTKQDPSEEIAMFASESQYVFLALALLSCVIFAIGLNRDRFVALGLGAVVSIAGCFGYSAIDLGERVYLAPTVAVTAASFFILTVCTPLIREAIVLAATVRDWRIFRNATLLWLPLASISVVAYTAANYRDQLIEESVYFVPGAAPWACRDEARFVCREVNGSLRGDLDGTATHVSSALASAIVERTDAVVAELRLKGEVAESTLIDKLFDAPNAALPAVLFELPECAAWWHWITQTRKCILRTILEPINNVYSNERGELRRNLTAALDEASLRGSDLGDAASRFARTSARDRISSGEHSMKRVNSIIFTWIDLASLFSLVMLLLVAARALLYIVLRQVYDEKVGGFEYRFGTRSKKGAAISAEDTTLPYGGAELFTKERSWFVVPRFSDIRCLPAGVPSFPQPFALLFRRVFCRKFLFDYHKKNGNTHRIEIQSSHGRRFVEVELQRHDRLIFDMDSLVAFSDGVTFELITRISLAALFQRRIFFSAVSGAGKVLLATRGGGLQLMPLQGRTYSSIEDAVAWDAEGGFQLKAQHDPFSTYFRTPNILPSADTLLILQPPSTLRGSVRRVAKGVLFWFIPL